MVKRCQQAATEPQSLPGRWAAIHPGVPRVFDSHTVAVNKVSNLPKQANLCDCGLFVLTYIEFFCACLPDTITAASSKAKKLQVNLKALAGGHCCVLDCSYGCT